MNRKVRAAISVALTFELLTTLPASGESDSASSIEGGAANRRRATSAATNSCDGLTDLLDAPLLFVKRHSYTGIHIYDTYYKWPPGGGGIYVLENPQAPREQWRVRAIIDPSTPDTLGPGVCSHPELSWDATKLLFCFKGEPAGNTSIYEIGIDGRGLRRLTDPGPSCGNYKGNKRGQHDIAPAYLPDGRIVFLSTRPSGLVPCNNTGVAILHVMNGDGSDPHPISVNNVNEFDPAVLPDGRILFGRWEYVDKNALTIQSLWTIHPDGAEETALFANNMVFPEAILDARPIPGSHRIVATLAKHNGPPRGSIAIIDPHIGKNDPAALVNLEHPENPTHDQGNSCEPWPLSENAFLFSGRRAETNRNAIEIVNAAGRRVVVLSDTDICLHSPMLVKPRVRPAILPSTADRGAKTGRFLVQDVYQGLTGVKRGDVKWLRLIEETSRVSGTHSGTNPYNQTFLVSAALAFSVKNYLGIVPVRKDGSAYFEAPSGRALYFQALDADGRLVQSMRTFVQAVPGVTRSCIGCHEHKFSAPSNAGVLNEVTARQPDQLLPESWGTGYIDYPAMVQPILDKHCVSCHGGKRGIAGGLDLSGGWTESFNISYENLVSRRETQLTAYWIAGIDCMNGTAHWSSQIFPPRSHGSGAAPLARLLIDGHEGRISKMTRQERDLVLAWIDSNGLYHGTWNHSESGCETAGWKKTKSALITEMRVAGCMRCHEGTNGIAYFENDWFNLREPQLSRILRAPLRKGAKGLGLGLCRERQVDPNQQRIQLLRDGYAHAVKPIDKFPRQPLLPGRTGSPLPAAGEPVASFASAKDSHYQKMLAIILAGREQALATPRTDMPDAEITAGVCRQLIPPAAPEKASFLDAKLDRHGVVRLNWESSARTIGLEAELHRHATRNFVPNDETLLTRTELAQYADISAPAGRLYYALVLLSGDDRSEPVYKSVSVPHAASPPAPKELKAVSASYSIRLDWERPDDWRTPDLAPVLYHVYRRRSDTGGRGSTRASLERLTSNPIHLSSYTDANVELERPYTYVVHSVSKRGVESRPSRPSSAAAKVVQQPVLTVAFDDTVRGILYNGEVVLAGLHGKAIITNGALDLNKGGHLTLPPCTEFSLSQPLSVECWVLLEKPGKSPVIASCGEWRKAGWFLQRHGEHWRWHVGGIDCDGGQPVTGRWVHLAGTFDRTAARLFVDGVQVDESRDPIKTEPWLGQLHLGQYSAKTEADFQVTGRIAGLKIYHRALSPVEITDAARNKPKEP